MAQSQLSAALGRVVDALKDAGVNATTDARNLNAPCAFVTVNQVAGVTLCGEIRVTADVYLIGNDRGGRLSIEELGKLLDHALTVLTLDEPARMVVATPPGLGGPVPALLITTTTD